MKKLVTVLFLLTIAPTTTWVSSNQDWLSCNEDGVMKISGGLIKCVTTRTSMVIEGKTTTNTMIVAAKTIARYDRAIPTRCIWKTTKKIPTISDSCQGKERGFRVQKIQLSVQWRRDDIPKVIIANERWVWTWTIDGSVIIIMTSLTLLGVRFLHSTTKRAYKLLRLSAVMYALSLIVLGVVFALGHGGSIVLFMAIILGSLMGFSSYMTYDMSNRNTHF